MRNFECYIIICIDITLGLYTVYYCGRMSYIVKQAS